MTNFRIYWLYFINMFRNPQLLLFVLLFPFVQVFIFSFLLNSQLNEFKDTSNYLAKIAVVSSTTDKILEDFTPYPSLDAAETALVNRDINGIVTFEDNKYQYYLPDYVAEDQIDSRLQSIINEINISYNLGTSQIVPLTKQQIELKTTSQNGDYPDSSVFIAIGLTYVAMFFAFASIMVESPILDRNSDSSKRFAISPIGNQKTISLNYVTLLAVILTSIFIILLVPMFVFEDYNLDKINIANLILSYVSLFLFLHIITLILARIQVKDSVAQSIYVGLGLFYGFSSGAYTIGDLAKYEIFSNSNIVMLCRNFIFSTSFDGYTAFYTTFGETTIVDFILYSGVQLLVLLLIYFAVKYKQLGGSRHV